MKNNIKKQLILLLINLLIPITCLCQVTFDSIEVKEIALICIENQKLIKENTLLKEQTSSLEYLNNLYVESESIKDTEINLYKQRIEFDNKTIKKLKSSQKKIIKASSLGGILLFILGLLI